jgi:hypothetical protein
MPIGQDLPSGLGAFGFHVYTGSDQSLFFFLMVDGGLRLQESLAVGVETDLPVQV